MTRNRSATAASTEPATGAITPLATVRLAYVDGLRALAAIVVTLHHEWLQIWPPLYGKRPGGATLLATGWLFYGHFAVSLFIVVSGFCLMLTAVRPGLTLKSGFVGFMARRARRILPPYYAALALAALLIVTLIGHKTGTHWDVSLPITAPALASRLLLLQDITGGAQFNHVFWSIALEWHIYLLLPLLILSFRRLGPFIATAASLAIAFGLQIKLRNLLNSNLQIQYVGLFSLGMLAAWVCTNRTPAWQSLVNRIPWFLIAGALIGLLVTVAWRRGFENPRMVQLDLLVGLIAAIVLIGGSAQPTAQITRALGARPLAAVGAFSYSVYLVHAPLIQLIWQTGIQPLGLHGTTAFALLALAGTPLIVAGACAFHLAFERPFMRSPNGPESLALPPLIHEGLPEATLQNG